MEWRGVLPSSLHNQFLDSKLVQIETVSQKAKAKAT